jgi:hypothetical protein
MRRDEQTYVVQSAVAPDGKYRDERDWACGLLQVIHYTQKRDAIAKAKRMAKHGHYVRVVRRIGAMLPITGDGWTAAIVWSAGETIRNGSAPDT